MAIKNKERKNMMLIGGIVLLSIFFFGIKGGFFPGSPSQSANIIPGSWDISKQVKQQNLQQYLVEEIDFDYSHPEIQKLAKEIKSSTNTPYDAVKMTAKYVYNNIQYSSGITVGYCYEETASSTLEVGKSDCVGMTRLNVALLRTMGIPARSVGGCLKSAERCSPIFAVAPGIQTKVTPMTEGDFKKRGFLHEWLEVWTPETGWLQVEATSGQIFSPEPECNQYIKYAYDSNQYDRCTITSQSFWNLCSVS